MIIRRDIFDRLTPYRDTLERAAIENHFVSMTKKKVLVPIYNEITGLKTTCKSCDRNVIHRLGTWFMESEKYYTNEANKVRDELGKKFIKSEFVTADIRGFDIDELNIASAKMQNIQFGDYKTDLEKKVAEVKLNRKNNSKNDKSKSKTTNRRTKRSSK